MKRLASGSVWVLLASFAVACAPSLPEASAPMDAMPAAPAPDVEQQAIGAAPPPGVPVSGGASGAKEPAGEVDKGGESDHMLIFRGTLDVRVDAEQFGSTLDAVVDAAAGLGGYIAAQDDHSVTVRVPSARFRDAIRAVEKLGEVTHRSVQAQDVTEEFHDLGVRLKSMQATRDRLQEFLGRAKTIEEVLRLEQELGRIAGEIDRLEGRIRFLQAQAAFSTLTVALEARAKPVVVAETTAPPPPPARTVSLPIEWISGVGLGNLLQLDD
jgi:uncharacterized protein DUF4349